MNVKKFDEYLLKIHENLISNYHKNQKYTKNCIVKKFFELNTKYQDSVRLDDTNDLISFISQLIPFNIETRNGKICREFYSQLQETLSIENFLKNRIETLLLLTIVFEDDKKTLQLLKDDAKSKYGCLFIED